MPHRYWLRILPLLFLAATFEHCYSILTLYRGGLNFPVLTTVLLVLAIDTSIYYCMQLIELLPARIILVLSGLVSVSLNVKYMLDWKPPGSFGLIIAVTVGILVPLMLCLFGWLEKALTERDSTPETNGNLKAVIQFHLKKYGEKSNRELAELIGCSHTTIRRYRKEWEASDQRPGG